MPKYNLFRPRVRSRHPSHSIIRPQNKTLPLLPFRSIIRFGSSTQLKFNSPDRVELNTVEAIANSSNKLLMKRCFTEAGVKTAKWWTHSSTWEDYNTLVEGEDDEKPIELSELPYPIISKHKRGSRGTGNKKHDNVESLVSWMRNRNLSNYIFEKFHNYTREYRLHISSNGCFYACRKMLKSDTPQEAKWYRNDEHCVWIMEENDLFDKPINWDDIVNDSVAALKSVGLDFGAIDLKIQSATNKKNKKRENPEYIIIEINSAPSFGDVTAEKYIEELPKLLIEKNDKKESIESIIR